MKRAFVFALLLVAATAHAAEPDYSVWTRILRTYYDPAKGMDYSALKVRDAAALQNLRRELGRVNVAALTQKEQLAYWLNVYNINTIATIVERYPVKSIRDLSTDPITRLNVFKKERVPFGNALLSLDDVENAKLREGFHDPRIHFAINCAAKSCPPMRAEAFTGANVDAQLDDQARRFLSSVRFGRKDDTLVIHVTKIADWFKADFEKWGGGRTAFIRRYLPPAKQQLIDHAKEIEFDFDKYDWELNTQ
ncbi:MAG: hypothetical protein QOI24_1782 [Acidobacteriota bacterium]|jgi:hypothetical protein|nr:hypothetical protein [Acidobacteriota bacterium]